MKNTFVVLALSASVLFITTGLSAQTTDTATKVNMKEVLVKPGEQAHEKEMTRKEALHIKSQKATVGVSKPGQGPNGIYLNGGLTALANSISGRNKRANKALQADNAAQEKKFTDTRYKPSLVAQLTNLRGDSLGVFMYNYPMPYQVARSYSDLEMKIWIRDNYKDWRAKGSSMQKRN